MRGRTKSICGVVILAGLVALLGSRTRHDVRICKVCGSHEVTDSGTWSATQVVITENELARWLATHGGHTHEWQWVCGETRAVIGGISMMALCRRWAMRHRILWPFLWARRILRMWQHS